MILSQRIAEMIEEMLDAENGEISIVRNELADRMGCVPSQINYVLTSRFTPDRGYIVESRRGGGGFIRIRKVQMQKNEYLMHFYHAVGDSLDQETFRAFLSRLISEEIITEREAELVFSALSDRALGDLPRAVRDKIRADAFKNAVIKLDSF